LAFNPTFDRALHGLNTGRGWEFSPNVKVSFDFTKKISGGFEYYGGLGPVSNFDPISQQSQQIFPVIDLNLSPNYEFISARGGRDQLCRSPDREVHHWAALLVGTESECRAGVA
jgi:hypothetical protein